MTHTNDHSVHDAPTGPIGGEKNSGVDRLAVNGSSANLPAIIERQSDTNSLPTHFRSNQRSRHHPENAIAVTRNDDFAQLNVKGNPE